MVKGVYYYASAMDKLKDHERAMQYINLLFDSEVSKEINNSFKDRDNILVNHFKISQDDCVDNDDSYYLPFMKKFREAQRDNTVEQIKNRELLK